MSLAVFNIDTASSSTLRSLDRHCRERTADGWSKIDPGRSHLNEILYGNEDGLSASLQDWFKRTGAKKPAAQAEDPYFTLVLSASPEHFRNGHKEFTSAAMAWLRKEAGDDLVFAELHLDETTPHIHVVVAPTYEKKKRKPGKMKKGETPEQFQERVRAAEDAPGVRTVGRSYHAWSGQGSYDRLRQSFCAATELGYGEKLVNQDGKKTRDWLKAGVRTLKEKIRELKVKWNGVEERTQQLDAASTELFKLQHENRKLHSKLHDMFFNLRSALPLASMKPEARARVEAAMADFKSLLDETDVEIKDVSRRANDVHDSVTFKM